MASIYAGDIGTIIEVQVLENNIPINIGTVDDIWLIFMKPNREQITKKKSLTELTITDAANGKFTFTATSGFWDVAGNWRAYPVVKFVTNSSEYTGTPFTWSVSGAGLI